MPSPLLANSSIQYTTHLFITTTTLPIVCSSCACVEGFTGPRCQQLKLSFTGGGWAWFDPLSQCEDGKTSFEILTTGSNSLLLYNGPTHDDEAPDFMSLELVDGYPKLRVNLGEGEIALDVRGQRLNNGKWHSLEVFKNNRVCFLFVCLSTVSLLDFENLSELMFAPVIVNLVIHGLEMMDSDQALNLRL